MSPLRMRTAVLLVSAAVIGLELAMMRMLSFRFWHHFAYMVISVALLGFGASGTALTLAGRRLRLRLESWMYVSSMLLTLAVPACWIAGRALSFDVHELGWNPVEQLPRALLLEGILFMPFFLAGCLVGLALMEEEGRTGGHYAANLAGSGIGALFALMLMRFMAPFGLYLSMAALSLAAGLTLLRPAASWKAAVAVAVTASLALFGWKAPREPRVSPYKMLAQVRAMPEVSTVHRDVGYLGRIDVVAGPSLHYAPGLGLAYTGHLPDHALILVDGSAASAVYRYASLRDFAFMDSTTAACAYHISDAPRVLVVGAGGGADLGLALFRGSREVVGLEVNGQVIEAMEDELFHRGGRIYTEPGVRVLHREARGYLAAGAETGTFDLVQLGALEPFGASSAGLFSTAESYLLTTQSLDGMLDRLGEKGVVSLTCWSRMPPRAGPRLFHLAATTLRKRGHEPAEQLAMIRSWATVTVLVSNRPLSTRDDSRIRRFCSERSFDLCYLPGIGRGETNRFHRLDRPYYFEAAQALLGENRAAFLDAYVFRLEAPTDDKPYFHHFFRWRAWELLRSRLGAQSRAFLELGTLLLWAALGQAAVLSFLFILLPLLPRTRKISRSRGRPAVLGYFLLLGLSFMFIEMGFFQKLILYLAHPVYSAAVVLSGFLLFAGAGSRASARWSAENRRVPVLFALLITALSLVYLVGMDRWLALSRSMEPWVRVIVALGTIGPLAFSMGHMFPAGLRRVLLFQPSLVPWAWAVNGCASVVATVLAPLLAMGLGFTRLILIATACYLLAGAVSLRLPQSKD